MKKNKLAIAPFDDIHIIGINTTLADLFFFMAFRY